MDRWFAWGAVASLALALIGCGDSDEDGGRDNPGQSPNLEARKPDTGAGAGQSVPNPRTCSDFCTRLTGCLVHLCNEDSKSTAFDGLAEFVRPPCLASCTESLLNTQFTATEWSCLYQKSCRQVLDYDECNSDSSYYCVGPGIPQP